MQLSNIVLRLGGSLLHTVPKTDVTPAEILVLKRLHGDDAVTEIRPTTFKKNAGHVAEYDRLAKLYDNQASESAFGGNEKSIMADLFPGAVKKLPATLEEIGLGHLMSPAALAAAERVQVAVPDEGEEVDLNAPAEDDEDDGVPEDFAEAAE